jgi:hypothetical protein
MITQQDGRQERIVEGETTIGPQRKSSKLLPGKAGTETPTRLRQRRFRKLTALTQKKPT